MTRGGNGLGGGGGGETSRIVQALRITPINCIHVYNYKQTKYLLIAQNWRAIPNK